MTNSKIKSVLFVCTGNSCRSVMAQGFLKKKLKESGKDDIKVFSAGTGAPGGVPPTEETIEVMSKAGVDVKSHRSAPLTEELIKKTDLVLVMDEIHLKEVIRKVPEAAQKVYLLKKFASKENDAGAYGFSIPDPIGRPLKDYENCFEMIKKEVDRITEIL